MSYCRFVEGHSDVYMLATGTGVRYGVECCNCRLSETGTEWFGTPEAAAEHLERHVLAGHLVPDEAIERLKLEADGVYWHGRNIEGQEFPPPGNYQNEWPT